MKMKNRVTYLLALVLVLVVSASVLKPSIVGFSILPLIPEPPLSSIHVSVSRDLPDSSVDRNVEYTATLSVTKGDNPPTSVTINEYVPVGWNVTSSSPAYASYDSGIGEITWLLIGPSFTTMDITYTFLVPGDASGTAGFTGDYNYLDPDTLEATTENISGETSVTVSAETTTSTTSTTSTSTTVEGPTTSVPTTTLPTIVSLSRDMADSVTSGTDLEVTLSLVKGDNPPNAVTITEYVPSGWTVTDSNPAYNGYDSVTGEIFWVFFTFDFYTRDITYAVTVPPAASGTGTFSGQYRYNHPDTSVATTETTSGDTNISVIGVTTTSTTSTTSTVVGTTTTIPPISLSRDLPSMVLEGESMDATLSLLKGEGAPNSVIIYEYIPAGWAITSTSPAPSETSDGLIKWLLWGSGFYSMDLTYSLTAPVDSNGTIGINGEFLYNDEGTPMNETTAGDTELLVKSPSAIAVAVNRTFLPASATVKAQASVRLAFDVMGTAPSSVIITDNFPAGWNVTSSSPKATSISTSAGRIRWNVTNVTDRNITYSIKVPANASLGNRTFSGSFSYLEDSTNITGSFGGDSQFTVAASPGLATVERDLPASANTGTCIDVELNLSDGDGVSVVVLDEYVPPGWNISSSSPAYTSFLHGSGKVTWAVQANQTVSYSVCPPANETEGSKTFTGSFSYSASYMSVVDPITGDSSVTVSSVPGDTDGDGEVNDFELLGFISEWSDGEVDDFDLLAAIGAWASAG